MGIQNFNYWYFIFYKVVNFVKKLNKYNKDVIFKNKGNFYYFLIQLVGTFFTK